MVGWFGRLRRQDDRGASLVEFALLAPLLVLLLFGMIDAGWAFSQHLEVRHGAREAARLAAVSAAPYATGQEIVDETCRRMTSTTDDVTVSLVLPGAATTGATAEVTVSRDHDSLTAFLPFFSNLTLRSAVEIRLEQDAGWSDYSDGCGP